ncbi:uncharacterized protein BJ212DRAFT_1304028 [Suillus subaureus]|uniref:DUF6534 domain-containing protein n=1 Tax=Suillus subaureus TaxID=48587 RepID=A0A9P7DXH5_9AGAM|nr:uncharacterized protein BJ212DRAFT_1304028 [Suillus subaureus]KAG1805572.1 hypothetical protein BJ212DRAFT_1304028 [Suillus subaureus]
MASLPTIYGAVLLGGFVASALSGIITAQTFTYIKQYPTDTRITKSIVNMASYILSRVLDSIHTGLWFGDEGKIDYIPAPLAISIALTAFLTLIVHWYATVILYILYTNTISVSLRIEFTSVVFAFLRLDYIIKLLHLSPPVEMIELQTMTAFRHKVEWVFTAGLSFSCVVDVLITASLCFTLRRSRSSYSNMDRIINSIILYTLENNALTSAATIISIICWVAMDNLVFLGVHFVLSKLYANSLLATLNSRKQLQEERSRGALSNELPVTFPSRYQSKYLKRLDPGNKLEINVGRTIEHEAADGFAKRSSHIPSESSPPTTDPNHITSNVV